MRFGSVCSGIEAASVAWAPLGWSADWVSEIDPFPSTLLSQRHPDTPNVGDMTGIKNKILSGELSAPPLLVGGTPCQAFSLAGNRKGLDDQRGQLTLSYVELLNTIDEMRGERNESICVWENVPGVLSSKDNAFGCFLAGLAGEGCELKPAGEKWSNAGCVYGPKRAVAWRVLDAQYFGVAQRRRRVFVVASARKGFNPRKVLFEFEGLRRDIAPSREEGQIAAALTASGVGTCGADDNQVQANHIVMGHRMRAFGDYINDETASTMKARDYKDATDLVVHGTQHPCVSSGLAFMMGRNHGQENIIFEPRPRRLTPIECERLQGFPDGYTAIEWGGKSVEQCPDGHRYKALGNSMAVPVMRWLGLRIINNLFMG